MVSGSPLRAWKILVICQPPSAVFHARFMFPPNHCPLPTGSVHTIAVELTNGWL